MTILAQHISVMQSETFIKIQDFFIISDIRVPCFSEIFSEIRRNPLLICINFYNLNFGRSILTFDFQLLYYFQTDHSSDTINMLSFITYSKAF